MATRCVERATEGQTWSGPAKGGLAETTHSLAYNWARNGALPTLHECLARGLAQQRQQGPLVGQDEGVRSCGTVNTRWKEGTGSSAALRSSTPWPCVHV